MNGLFTAACFGSVLIVLILLLRLTLQKHLPRRVFPALWYVAALRLLLPLSIPSPLSVWNLVWQASAQQGSPTAVADALLPFPAQRTGDILAAQSTGSAPVDPLRLIWLCGVALLAGYFLIGYVLMLRRLRGRVLLPDAAACDMLRRFGVSRAALRATDSCRAPLTCGILHPMIFLPNDLPQTDARFALVLAHELAHVRRRDCVGKLALVLCLCLYWWNPLVWVMVLTAGRDTELACDEAVLAVLGSGQKKAYALTLLDMAQRQTQAHPLHAGFGFSRSATELRLRALLSPRRAPAWLGMCVLAAFLLTSGALATQPLAQNESAAAPEHTAQSTAPAPITPAPVEIAAAPDGIMPADTPEVESPTTPAYIWPLEDADAVITQSFGVSVHPITKQEVTHYGIDIAVPSGTGVLAAAAGTVTECCYSPAYGYRITLTHADGLQTQYAHLREFLVEAGDTVTQGALIARSGASSWATGAHLHFAVLENAVYRDPLTTLSAE